MGSSLIHFGYTFKAIAYLWSVGISVILWLTYIVVSRSSLSTTFVVWQLRQPATPPLKYFSPSMEKHVEVSFEQHVKRLFSREKSVNAAYVVYTVQLMGHEK